MKVHFETAGGAVLRPARLEFSMLTSVPDRPPGTHELCPVVHLDDEVVVGLADGKKVETATGAILTPAGGWAVLDIRKSGLGVVAALDLGDEVVKRMLNDAPAAGLMLGLLAPTCARVVRISPTEVVAKLRSRAAHAIPAGPAEQRQLLGRLLDHLDDRRELRNRDGADGEQEYTYLALPSDAQAVAQPGSASAETMLN